MYLVTNTSMNRIFCDLLKCDRDLRETSQANDPPNRKQRGLSTT